jgi:5'-nucleotidase
MSGSTAQEAWTALTASPPSATVLAAESYAAFTVQFLAALFAQLSASPSLLPRGITLNVNFPAIALGCGPDSVQWVLTRVFPVIAGNPDVEVCGNGGRLPEEINIADAAGCFASVSVINATSKLDAGKADQADVLNRLSRLRFICFESS